MSKRGESGVHSFYYTDWASDIYISTKPFSLDLLLYIIYYVSMKYVMSPFTADVCKLSPWTPGTWQPHGEHFQYYISTLQRQGTNQKDAQEQCQSCGARLPSVINRAEHDF